MPVTLSLSCWFVRGALPSIKWCGVPLKWCAIPGIYHAGGLCGSGA